MDTQIWRFQWICISGANPKTPFFAVENIAAAEAGKLQTLFCVYYQNNWYSYQTTPDWSVIAMTAAKYQSDTGWVVLAVSASGRVWELRPNDKSEAVLRLEARHTLTNLATVDGVIYACGMGRVMMRREVSGYWSDISAPQPSLDEGVIGFTAAAGLHENLLYAVGWRGEIWTRTIKGWEREDTPSNANLNSLAIDADGTVYVVGDKGVMLKGRHGYWESIETNINSNLMDVCIHDGRVYVCTDFEIFHLSESGLEPEFNDDEGDGPDTCLKLASAGAGGLYSVGPYDVFRLLDGAWSRVA